MPLPSPFVPSFISRLYLAATVLLHGLMLLMQHWSIDFRCWLKYPPADLRDATFVKVCGSLQCMRCHAGLLLPGPCVCCMELTVQVMPQPHKGRPAVVALQRSKRGETLFEFQKFKFVYSNTARAFVQVCLLFLPPYGHPISMYIFATTLELLVTAFPYSFCILL